jgi:hypothetical protein
VKRVKAPPVSDGQTRPGAAALADQPHVFVPLRTAQDRTGAQPRLCWAALQGLTQLGLWVDGSDAGISFGGQGPQDWGVVL